MANKTVPTDEPTQVMVTPPRARLPPQSHQPNEFSGVKHEMAGSVQQRVRELEQELAGLKAMR